MGNNVKGKKEVQEKVSRVIGNSLKYLNNLAENSLDDMDYIPESIQPYISRFVREGRANFDILSDSLANLDKSSDDFMSVQKEVENIARTFITVKDQIEKYKKGIGEFKDLIPRMNKGTQDSNYYVNSAVFGDQWDDLAIDKEGRFNFKILTGGDDKTGTIFTLDDMTPVEYGNRPIITEPFVEKTYVYDLSLKTKEQKDRGEDFDPNWVYNNTLTRLSDAGSQRIVGLAFTDIAGDGRTQSFAEIYETGLKDESLYIHPDTGEKLPKDNVWMKDPANSEVVSKLLSKHITNIMGDIHGNTVQKNEMTEDEALMRIIEKYRN